MLTLTGISNYSGTASITAGRLKPNGSAAVSAFTVSGGILSGNATGGALTISSRGSLSPGNSPGVVQLWSPERRQPLRATMRMPVAATKLARSPDDRRLAIGSEKDAIYVLEPEP